MIGLPSARVFNDVDRRFADVAGEVSTRAHRPVVAVRLEANAAGFGAVAGSHFRTSIAIVLTWVTHTYRSQGLALGIGSGHRRDRDRIVALMLLSFSFPGVFLPQPLKIFNAATGN